MQATQHRAWPQADVHSLVIRYNKVHINTLISIQRLILNQNLNLNLYTISTKQPDSSLGLGWETHYFQSLFQICVSLLKFVLCLPPYPLYRKVVKSWELWNHTAWGPKSVSSISWQ